MTTTHVIGTIAPAVEREDPIEHVAQTAAEAINDLNAAIWTATSRRQLILLRELSASLIQRLELSWSSAMTLDEKFDDMRSK